MFKKILSFVIIISFFLFVYQLLIVYLKTGHEVEYAIEVNDSIYEIKEIYKKKGEVDYYLFNVKRDDKEFIISTPNNFNKQREVVSEILEYEKDDLLCVSLKYIGNESASAPLCFKDNGLYSYQAISNDTDFDNFVKSIPAFSSSLLLENGEAELITTDFYAYKNNLYDDENLLVYMYKNILRLNREGNREFIFSGSDNYSNDFGILIDKYYVIPKLTKSNPEISTYMIFNIEADLRKEVNVSPRLSKQFYVNGVYDGKLYIFDKSNMKQYSVDPYNELYELVSDDENGVIYYNGERKTVSLFELANTKLTFTDEPSFYSNIDYDNIFVFDTYAIYSKNNNWYKVYNEYLDNPIYLLNGKDIKEVKAKDGRIYYIKNEYLYRFDDYGNVPLIKRDEFKYNYKNIYDVYLGSN